MSADDYIEVTCLGCHALLASQDYDDMRDYLATHWCAPKRTSSAPAYPPGRLF